MIALLAILIFCGNGFASEASLGLQMQQDSQFLDELTRSREELSEVELLHLGIRSRPRRLELISQAERFIFIKMPYWYHDFVGQEHIEALRAAKAARPELDLRITFDWMTMGQSGQLLKNPVKDKLMKITGRQVLTWSPAWWQRGFSFNPLKYRMHDKVFVVDGHTAILGGMNIADKYLLGGADRLGWHDTDILLKGPAATEVSRLFLAQWELGQRLKGPTSFPIGKAFRNLLRGVYWLGQEDFEWETLSPQTKRMERKSLTVKLPGEFLQPVPAVDDSMAQPVRVIYDDPLLDEGLFRQGPKSKTGQLVAYLLKNTKSHVRAILPYLTLTREMRTALKEASLRGVRVELITNSLDSHDLGDFAYYGSVTDILELLKAGVSVYEWKGHRALWDLEKSEGCSISARDWHGHTIHTKGFSFDGEILLIGSHNINVRSEKFNNEITALVRSADVAREFEAIFERDLDLEKESRVVSCGGETFERPRRVLQLERGPFERFVRKNKTKISLAKRLKAIM